MCKFSEKLTHFVTEQKKLKKHGTKGTWAEFSKVGLIEESRPDQTEADGMWLGSYRNMH